MSATPLPTAAASARTLPLGSGERERLAGRVRLLSWASLGYLTLEGTIAILAGVLAGSVALIRFGIDSAIEGFASAIIVWRFTGQRNLQRRRRDPRAEARCLQSVNALIQGERPDVSWLGIALSASSVIVMPYLGTPVDSLSSVRLN